MSKFFIDRPVLAWVVAIAIMLFGAICIFQMSINQYPSIAPVQISVTATYSGASAQTVQDTVVKPIEQELTGLDNLRYITSQANNDGSATIIVTFNQGTNPDIAQVQTQNKVSLAESSLPSAVTDQGLDVRKYQQNFFQVISISSKSGRLSSAQLGDLLVSNLQDSIARTAGVGDYQVMGAEGAMRIWMDPAKLHKYNLMPSDVVNAIDAQNVQLSSGQIGGAPTLPGTQTNATIMSKSRFTNPDQFKNILLKENTDGSQVRVKDIGTVEFGSENYSISSSYNGQPSAGIALRLASGANVLETVKAVEKTIEAHLSSLPDDIEVQFPYDTAPVTSASIEEVVKTLLEAIALVFLVMYLFLQNIRATLVPTLVVPVVLLGTFGILHIFGYTINILTMFGMVLAIGLLVDDAIVVVENVERVMQEKKLGAREATRESMGEIQGALVGIGIVITAVMLPMAFMSGSTGIIYRQFSITVVSSMLLSVVMALIFTPALCASLLRAKDVQGESKTGFFGWFNRLVEKSTNGYVSSVAGVIKRRILFSAIYIVVLAAVIFFYSRQATTFLPDEDQGVVMVQLTLPPNASAERTQQVISDVTNYELEHHKDALSSVFSANGFSFAGRGQNMAIGFIKLKDWSQRTESADQIASATMQHFANYKDAKILAMIPPAVMELGNATGFDFFLLDSQNKGHNALMNAKDQLLALAAKDPRLSQVRLNGIEDTPMYQINIDDERLQALGISISDVNDTLQDALGGNYTSQFTYENRTKKVYIQGRARGRVTPEDINQWYVRNSSGDMVPFSAFASGHWSYGSPDLHALNGTAGVEIQGSPGKGYSSSDATRAIEEIVQKLPGYSLQWYGLSYEEQAAGSQAPMLYTLSIIVVFLALAGLYGSWSIPISILMVVPFGVLGALLAILFRGIDSDIFFNVGLLITVGLSAKNAILIVEFAKDIHEKEGKSLLDAALQASRIRIRPIIMTSMAFILGVLPLSFASGAGAGSEHSIGTGVVGGMIAATFLAIFYVPLFYVLVVSLFNRRKEKSITQASSQLAAEDSRNDQ
ncbi:efflux RND transporter permease subunit [Citrobacter amalonaticus]